MKTTLRILLVIAVLGAPSASFAQSVLDAYIAEGLQSNLQLRQEQLNYEKSIQNLQVAKSLFLPYVALNASYTLATGGRKIEFPIGDLLNPVYTTLNKLTDTNQFPQLANQSIQFLPNNFHDTKVRIIQPLFNPDIYFNYKAQKELISIQQAQKDAYQNELKFSITSAYYQYLQTEEALIVLTETREFLTELLKVNQRLLANEKVTRDAVLSAEYEISKIDQQIGEMTKNREVARSYFNFLLNKDLSSSIIKDSTLVANGDTRSIEDLTQAALNGRQELRQLQSGLAAGDQLLELNKANSFMPNINMVGDVGYQGFAYKFNGDQQYALLQFNLSWDLFHGGQKKAKTQQAKLDYQVAENRLEQLRKQIELQVIQSYQERAASEQAWKTAQSGVRSAEKNFQIVRSRYQEGQAILLEYLDAQNKWTSARMNEAVRLYDLLRAEAALQKTIASI